MTRLEQLIKERNEWLEKKKEKERAKKEKKKAKDAEKKAAARQRRKERRAERSRQHEKEYNRNYERRRRARIAAERRKNGDKYGSFCVMITKDHVKQKSVGTWKWKANAYKAYNEAIEKNKEETLYPIETITSNSTVKDMNMQRTREANWEILIVEKIPEGNNNVRRLRNKDGKFVENVVTDRDDYIIVTKHPWLIEEKFRVYGYHPYRDKKTAHFILNEMLLKDYGRDNIKRVFTYNDKVIIQYDDDFDFIECKTNLEAEKLYGTLQKKLTKMKMVKYILFTGDTSHRYTTWLLNMLEEKTGWDRDSCKAKYHISG